MTNNTEAFVENTKKIIQNSGYKQTFIAQKMNISARKLSDILNYRKVVDIEIICSLCNVLEVSPNKLFGYDKSA